MLTGFSLLSHYIALMLLLTLWSEFPTPQPCCLRTTLCMHMYVCVYACVCECVHVCVVGRDSEPNNVAATPASGPQPVESWCQADKHTRTRSHPRAHTLQKISVTFSLALSQSFPVIYCISCGLGAEMAHYVGCVSVYVCVCARMCMRVSVCMYECD